MTTPSEADDIAFTRWFGKFSHDTMIRIPTEHRIGLREAFAAHRIASATAATTAERERIIAKLAAAREQLREAHGSETAAGFDWAIAIVTGGKSPAPDAPLTAEIVEAAGLAWDGDCGSFVRRFRDADGKGRCLQTWLDGKLYVGQIPFECNTTSRFAALITAFGIDAGEVRG